MKLFNYLLIIVFFILIFSMTFTTSDDFNQDLGRHLKLGEIITKTYQVPKINLFSYTNPNFPFINHHWLSEVIFYLSTKYFGLNSLIIIKVTLFILTMALTIILSTQLSSLLITIFTATLFSPLLLERNGIRPEIFAYLLFSILLFIILKYPKIKKFLYLTPFIMLLWINLHISFIFGIILCGLLALKFNVKRLTLNVIIIFFLTFLALFINPNSFKGVLYPFTIFRNYGYTIAENQNIFFLSKMLVNPLIKYFFLLSPIILLSFLILLFNKKIIESAILLFFFCLTIFQLRHMPFFVITAIPLVSYSFNILLLKNKKIFTFKIILNNYIQILLLIILVILSIFFMNNTYSSIFDKNVSFGLGFTEDSKQAVNFLIRNNLPKNILNNFDIGGYLIYRLYPQYKLFVDNRPEAYPQEFFKNIYIEMQTNQLLANKIIKKYNINTIFLNHTDQTEWSRVFLESIAADKQWKMVYADYNNVIFTLNSNLLDIRNNSYFNYLINKENNYLNLLKLARFLNILKNNDLSLSAYNKAKEINPNSCSINRSLYNQYFESPYYFLKEQEVKNNYWYCF